MTDKQLYIAMFQFFASYWHGKSGGTCEESFYLYVTKTSFEKQMVQHSMVTKQSKLKTLVKNYLQTNCKACQHLSSY
jgi:hypothetical protein